MHGLEDGGTSDEESEISTEIYLDGTVESILGDHRTDELVDLGVAVGNAEPLGVATMLLKYHYDRVRPNYLDTTLEPSISVPGHPASYPSGHARNAGRSHRTGFGLRRPG